MCNRIDELEARNRKLCKQLRESQCTNQRLADDVHELTYRWGESKSKFKEEEGIWKAKVEAAAQNSLREHQAIVSHSLEEVEIIRNQIQMVTADVERLD